MSTPECESNHVCFYREPDFRGEVASYSAPVSSCQSLPFQARSYQNVTNEALVGYIDGDCQQPWGPIDSSDSNVEPHLLSFGPAE
jgi:Peptidase inhibitor family I36